jgi:excisionase family DNA binding protein
MPKTHDTQELLTSAQSAAIAGVHRATIVKWVTRGELRAVQHKPQILIDREDLDRFLQSRKQATDAGDASPANDTAPIAKSSENTLVFTRKDAAVLLGVAPDTINRWRRDGRLQATPEGEIPLTEIERIVAANIPASGPQLELLREPMSQALENVGGQSSVWILLARLLEASHQREAKLNDLLNRTLTLLETRSRRPSGEKPIERQLTNRVLTFLQSNPGPYSSGEIREALDLPETPRYALGKLVNRKLINRLSPGVFEAIPEPFKSDSPLEPAKGTLMARVLAYVRQMTGEGSSKRGVVSWEVQQALDLPQSPLRTLSRLTERGLIYRIREGFYSARPLEVDKKGESVGKETEKEDQ